MFRFNVMARMAFTTVIIHLLGIKYPIRSLRGRLAIFVGNAWAMAIGTPDSV